MGNPLTQDLFNDIDIKLGGDDKYHISHTYRYVYVITNGYIYTFAKLEVDHERLMKSLSMLDISDFAIGKVDIPVATIAIDHGVFRFFKTTLEDHARLHYGIENIPDKYLNDKIIMNSLKSSAYSIGLLSDQKRKYCYAAINIDPYCISNIKNQTRGMCLKAVSIDGSVISHIQKQTKEICLAAVSQNGYALQYVDLKKRTADVCLAAVKESGLALKYVEKQTFNICLEAVKKDGMALEFVHIKFPEIILAAVKQNGLAIKFTKNHTDEIKFAAVSSDARALKYITDQTEELCELAINSYADVFGFVNEQTPRLRKLAVERNPAAIKYIEDQTDELIDIIVHKHNFRGFEHVMVQTVELCKRAIDVYSFNFTRVRDRTDEIWFYALDRDPKLIRYDNTSNITYFKYAISKVDLGNVPDFLLNAVNQTPEICRAAMDLNTISVNCIRDKKMGKRIAFEYGVSYEPIG